MAFKLNIKELGEKSLTIHTNKNHFFTPVIDDGYWQTSILLAALQLHTQDFTERAPIIRANKSKLETDA